MYKPGTFCLSAMLVILVSFTNLAHAQNPKRTVYRNENFGFSFDYDPSFKLVDNSFEDRLKLVLQSKTFFIYITTIKESKTPGSPFVDLVAGYRIFTGQDTTGKRNYKINDLMSVKNNINGRKAYSFTEEYSFDNGPMTDHYIFMEFPNKDKAGVAVRARTMNSGLDFYTANDEMMAVLASFKKL